MLAATRPNLWRHHPSVLINCTKKKELAWKEQLLLLTASKQPLSEKSDRANAIIKALRCFIAKDMQPYALEEDAGFQNSIKVFVVRYNIPSH